MSEVRANSITNAAGTGAPNFPNGATSGGVTVATTTEVAAAAVPAGSVVQFARNTAPTGWLKANGAAVSRTDYAALFSAIGTTFGAGNGSTTFNLPDLRGEFLRGWDDGRGIDSGRAFGSAQADELKSHTHTTVEANQATSPTFSGVNYLMATNGTATNRQVNATGGTETRPRNIALLVCIKF